MKISIITVTYNSEKTIEETIKSILEQTYSNFEHIIIDGNSKDKTMEIVKRYECEYNGRLKYISEKDKGIYDAMNKGIRLATGDIIGLLNSDDKYADSDVLKNIVQTFENNKNCEGTYSDLLFLDENTMTKVVRKWNSKKGNIKFGWHPPHPTLYLKKKIYDKIGLFNLEYKIVADYDFMIRLLKSNIKLIYIKKYLIHMRSGGTSTNGLKGYVKNMKESYKALKNNQIKFPLIITINRILKTIWQMMLAKMQFKNSIK